MALISDIIKDVKKKYNGDNVTENDLLSMIDSVVTEFSTLSSILQDIILVKAPPFIDYTITFEWEREFCKGNVYSPCFNDGTKSCMFLFEMNEDTTIGNNFLTSGSDIEFADPTSFNHMIPFSLPEETESISWLSWDKTTLRQVTKKELERDQAYGSISALSTNIHSFAFIESKNYKGFVCSYTPYEYQTDGTNEQSILNEALLDNVFYILINKITARITSKTDTFPLPNIYKKYIVMGVLSKLWKNNNSREGKFLSKHYKQRYEVGKQIAKKLQGRNRQVSSKSKETAFILGKPTMPRLIPY